MTWSTACVDWQERIVQRRSLIPSPLFANEAEEALRLFKSLRVVDLPGKPTFGEVCGQWVFDFVAAIFGAYDRETGDRLIKEFFLLISKKNSKSTIAAGILVTALARNWRYDNELLMLAPTIKVANNCFTPAMGMIREDPDLSAMMLIQEHERSIKHLVTNAELKIVAADTEVVSGTKAGFVLIDELWIFGKRSKAAAMLQEATGGLISKKEGFVIYLSTQSDEQPAGVFREKLDYARAVRDGTIEDNEFLGVLYEFPDEMIERGDYLKPEFFYITNPNLDRSVSMSWLKRELQKVINPRAEGRQTFLAKHLNVEIGMRLARDRWRGADYWLKAKVKRLTLAEFLDRCEVVTAGVDGGGLDDLMALTLVGRDKVTGRWLLWSRAWAQSDVFEQRKDIVTQLERFIEDGDLVAVPEDDPTLDIREIVEICKQVQRAGKFPEAGGIGCDPHAIGALVDLLAEEELTQPLVCSVAQGYRQTGSVWTMERKLKDQTLQPVDQGLTVWAVGNAKAEQRGNATYVTKETAGRAKIDPLVAAFNAVDLMGRNPVAVGPSVYEERGIRMI